MQSGLLGKFGAMTGPAPANWVFAGRKKMKGEPKNAFRQLQADVANAMKKGGKPPNGVVDPITHHILPIRERPRQAFASVHSREY
tara:strand:+ start:1434 stop:1688 length:255 start_codon:yes stop_codon:yes gene_type:complete